MFNSRYRKFILALAGLALLGILIFQIPAINRRLSWRLEIAQTYLRGVIHPVEAVPTPNAIFIPPTPEPATSATPEPSPTNSSLLEGTNSPTPTLTPTITQTPTAIPESVYLPAPNWVSQDQNNCGPAALSMYLNYYGWDGDQYQISFFLDRLNHRGKSP